MALFSIFRNDNKINGFSLLEMMVVLTITGIMLMVGGSLFTDYRKNVRLKEAATIFMSDIKLAKQKATTENVAYKCEFQLSNDTIYSFGPYVGGIITNPVTRRLHDVSSDISFRRVSSTEVDNGIILQPRGTATTGFVVLQNKNKKIKIDINATGRLTIDQNYTE
jgi:prepilin-type N-terminal cleavage/methylation domain-containing protein